MRVVTCLFTEHNLWLVLLAALMCLAGSFVSVKLFERTIAERSGARFHWCFLSAVTGGAAIWATHFIAMLGYRPAAPITFDATLTIVSALIAVVGIAAGLTVAMAKSRAVSVIAGGGLIGLAVAAMHYVGMFAYRVGGIVQWSAPYVIASVVLAVVFSAIAIDRLRASAGPDGTRLAACLFATAIVALHFTGMAAFSVVPTVSGNIGADSDAFSAMAAAIALVGLLIVGTGISTHLVERRVQVESQQQLQHIALHDALTEIGNRHAFNEALSGECEKLRRYGRPFALLLVDLDRFKPVNDSLGHPVGDEVLRRVASRMRSAVRAGDMIARIGGDEFAVIAYGVEEAAEADGIARRIVEILSRPFVVSGNVAEIGGSVGITLAPHHGTDAEKLVHQTDIALYTAKAAGKNCHCLFEPRLNEAIQRRRYLESELRLACMREDFTVVYQPVIDSGTGAFSSAEALLRWNCPGRGDIPPSEFIPIAEELGLISRIGASVLRTACRDAASWPADIDLAVNISPVQLIDPRLPQTVAQALEESGLPASRLELEITETALLGNDDMAMRTLTRLRDMGLRISLDDFGTGYSSLSYLHRFPISRIKIDKSFVQRLPSDMGSVSIVRAIAQLGGSLDMKITAEGIETDEQLAFISQHGCDHVQGFLISRPIGAAAIFDLFAAKVTA